ncbi:CHC2 zinc finger domain-containing protein [Moraxella nasovis]|uniref:CHC2 zinc finger domain-containing protein n=1 Tax=Moraxella nasovis TaxID=2904121 RepID=UPI001F614AA2|nr:CHC2 zinc finger domain-containing protein [Moraxella nasovis]UNU73652.1 CHC2 zinc finger domain-containing protein [Moraxella nasovis]
MSNLTQFIRPIRHKKQFNKSRLPTPSNLYGRFGIVIKHTNWNMARCPFHDDKHASMSVNGTHGGFICHACHEKGSMIAFYMRMTAKDYKTAMIDLGAYDE